MARGGSVQIASKRRKEGGLGSVYPPWPRIEFARMSTPARLEVVAGNAAGTWLDVGDELLIGRHADGVGGLGGDEQLSRYHARLSVSSGGGCAIEDLGSTNGTLVNGSRITETRPLSVGDTIELGGT